MEFFFLSVKKSIKVMADKSPYNYEKFEDESQKGTTTHRFTIHINSSAIRRVLEVASTFFWVMMVLWAELASIILFVYILVSRSIFAE